MNENHEREFYQSRREGDLSSISGALVKLGQKVRRVCPDCGEEFQATNLGPATAVYCRKCGEERDKRQEEQERLARESSELARYRAMIALASIPPKWKDVTFDNTDPNRNPRAFEMAKQYAEKFSTESPSLAFYSSGNGTGKTRLGACIINHVLHKLRQPVMFKKARDLMLELRRTFADGAIVSEADILDKVSYVKLLLLDDVGVDPPSRWIHSTYWTVFDRRLEWHLPVVITTNKPFEAPAGQESLADYIGDGALSRLVELCQGTVIDMSGLDLR